MELVHIKYDIKYFLHNINYWRKYRTKRASKRNVLYFIFEPNGSHPGLADRLKAIISLYNLAKKNGYDFRFYYETPFKLSDYLAPKRDWELKLDELEYSLTDTKIINETNWHDINRLKKDKQYHCYCYSGNKIPWKFNDTGYKWFDLFHELFTPSQVLNDAINQLGLSDTPFISVQFRFVNALEQFEGITFFNNRLKTQEERQKLIHRCKQSIMDIQAENADMPIYVFSDSKVFLDSLSDMPVHVLDSNNIGHTGTNTKSGIHMKTFIDLFAMSKSKTIYRVRAKELYNESCFALLAARIGDTEFIDKYI